MKIFEDPQSLRSFLEAQKGERGFVPTMGALHEGHLSLIRRAKAENQITVVSLFLNPTQFDNPEDLAKYPSSLDKDLELLKAERVDVVFLPQTAVMYPDEYRYQLRENSLSKTLCGEQRPGHFDGMLTIVMKLFQIVQPKRAYFGEKDFQQLQLVQGMVEAFFLPIEIVPCPIVRDDGGLALSSRNRRLSNEGLKKAQSFAKSLASGARLNELQARLHKEGIEVDYLKDLGSRRFAAVRIEGVRLIDNVAL